MSMNSNIKVGTNVRLTTKGGSVTGRLCAVERNDDDTLAGVIIKTLADQEISSLYFTTDEITQNGWTIESLSDPDDGIQDAVKALCN